MARKVDWKSLGVFNSTLTSLLSLVREVLTQAKVGLEILPWLLAEGRPDLTAALQGLAVKFLATQRWRKIDRNTIEVNLGAPPTFPFDRAQVEWNNGEGWVNLQKRRDGLYQDGRKIILWLSERQKNGQRVQGYDLRDEVTGQPVLHPNVLDALLDNQHLIPEDWKSNEEGKTLFIYFWAAGFRGGGRDLVVRGVYFNGGRWRRFCFWLGFDWDVQHPAASLAS